MIKIAEYRKQKNKGFTLLEVLIAVVIIAIISIPVFRAIVTAANTTAKSTKKMTATNAAENIMEDIESLTVEEVIDKYGLTVVDADKGIYKATIVSPDSSLYSEDVNEALGKGYSVEIKLDPSHYTNANSLNLADYNAVSASTSAIVSLDASLDKQAIDYFDEKRKLYATEHKEAESLSIDEKYVKRLITVEIDATGETFSDEDGKEFPVVEVNVEVEYYLSEAGNTPRRVPVGSESTLISSRQVFNNVTSQNPLTAVFIMYEPYFKAASEGGDKIVVINRDSIETNLYVIAQSTTNEAYSSYVNKSGKPGLDLQIYEDVVDGKQPITLRTNLMDPKKVEMYKDNTNSKEGADRQIPVSCYLTVKKLSTCPIGKLDVVFDDILYKKIDHNKGKFEDNKIAKDLNVETLDGKTGDASTIGKRIYDVTVTVSNGTVDRIVHEDGTVEDIEVTEWPVSVTLTGTMLEKDDSED